MSNAVITGVTGFVGSRLALDLSRKGWTVHGICREDSDASSLAESKVTLDRFGGKTGQLLEIMERRRPDVVFHLASRFVGTHAPDDIRGLIEANILFGTQLLEGMTRAGCSDLVFAGTSWQHFESHEYDPVSLYGATKQAFQDIVKFYTEVSSLRALALKLFDTFGPGDKRPKLFNMLRDAAKSGRALEMSPGEQYVDLVHVDDAVSAFQAGALLLKDAKPGTLRKHAVSSGQPRKLREVVETYARVTGQQVPVAWGKRSYRPREMMTPWNAGDPIRGWKAKVSLEEGLRQLVSP